MKTIRDPDKCRDCQVEPPAFIAGIMYKRCLPCLQIFDAKKAENAEAKRMAFKQKMDAAGKKR